VRLWHPQTAVGGTDMVLLAEAGIRYLLEEPRTEWAGRDDGMRVQSGRGQDQDDHNHAGRPPLPLKWVGRGWLGGSMQAGVKVSAATSSEVGLRTLSSQLHDGSWRSSIRQ
jgi:hypothetical protein